MSLKYSQFPSLELSEIRNLEGNDECCDCFALRCDWASVNHGILLCLDCAGRHRSFGVRTSTVKSLFMDSWSLEEIEYLKRGGNTRFHDILGKAGVGGNVCVSDLYLSQAAERFRRDLKEIVSTAMMKSETNPSIILSSSPNTVSGDASTLMEVIFSDGPMGMSISRDHHGRAYVSRLVTLGPAESKGVNVGDVVEDVSGKCMSSYEQVMHAIQMAARPLQITFHRRHRAMSLSPPEVSSGLPAPCPFDEDGRGEACSDVSLAVPLPATLSRHRSDSHVTIDTIPGEGCTVDEGTHTVNITSSPRDFRVLFETPPLGMTVSRGAKGRAEVARVSPGGAAGRGGVMTGDIVIGLGGQWLGGFDSFMQTIASSADYPITIVFRRPVKSDLPLLQISKSYS